jgi:hypothetical protein
LRANAVDDAHGAHVIDAWIEAELVEDHDPVLFRLRIQRPHRVGHVARREHVLFQSQAILHHVHVHDRRQHADHEVMLRDQRRALIGVRRIERHGMRHLDAMLRQRSCVRFVAIRHRHTPFLLIGMVDQIADQGGSRTAGAEDEDGTHGWKCESAERMDESHKPCVQGRGSLVRRHPDSRVLAHDLTWAAPTTFATLTSAP